ncbi:hypothetical protein L195_g032912 [Trifolium pratense]|uniref:Uncharacterized protein n=1 Tax=Trifolium pratense TaxID=57577 RepID=A0A2K3LEI2_TRIPR|nr:hypothetical protein L195_g032912 [Trifolium pratense]
MPSTPPVGGIQAVTGEDPLIEIMIRAKDNVVGDVIIPEGEPSIPYGVVNPMQVEDVRATTPKVDQQTLNLGLVGSWSGSDSGHI